MGDLSAHFDRSEFRCHHCGRIKLVPALVWHLEVLRSDVGRALVIVSGYRCPVHNRAVRGAKNSRHMVGDAADLVEGVVTVDEAAAAGFRGIGHRGQWATHVDLRPQRSNWSYGPARVLDTP